MNLLRFATYTLLLFIAIPASSQESGEKLKKEKTESTEKNSPTSTRSITPAAVEQQAGGNYLDYYMNERNANFSQNSKEISSANQKQLDDIVVQLEELAPESFEFHFAKYVNGNYDAALYPNLQKAYELNPAAKETLPQFVAYGEMVNDASIKKEYSKKLKDANVFSPAEMEYNYNVLMSIGQNGVVLTNGQVDTYPLWIWQTVDGVRPDITVVNLDLLENTGYRNRIGEKLALGSKFTTEEDREKRAHVILKNAVGRNVHVALTVSPDVFSKYNKNLWATGLVFKYDSESQVNNLTMLATHWQRDFRKDHMHENIGLNRNYVIPLSLLSTYYQGTGQSVELNEVTKVLDGLNVTRTKTKKATLKRY
jgi:hypothetical protein